MDKYLFHEVNGNRYLPIGSNGIIFSATIADNVIGNTSGNYNTFGFCHDILNSVKFIWENSNNRINKYVSLQLLV